MNVVSTCVYTYFSDLGFEIRLELSILETLDLVYLVIVAQNIILLCKFQQQTISLVGVESGPDHDNLFDT